jgi:sporulation integral membrane protein YlbJ
MFLVLAGFFAVLLLTALLSRPYTVICVRRLAIPALCILFIAGLLIYSGTAMDAARDGLSLWAGVVVPALLPFFIGSEIMNSTGFARIFGILLEPVMKPLFNVPGSASFALVMGVSSGYPVGAKITSDLKNRGLLSRTEAERLLAFTNNSGPLFVVGTVGTGMCGSAETGVFLLVCHLLACMTVGFLYRFYGNREKIASERLGISGRLRAFKNKVSERHPPGRPNIGTILGEAVKNSVSIIMTIGGFIILFTVIIRILAATGAIRHLAGMLSVLLSPLGMDAKTMEGILCGLLEITAGSNMICSARAAPYLKLPALSFIIGWAGLSVHLQVTSIISGTNVRMLPYLSAKFLQGIIAALYTRAGLILLPSLAFAGIPAMGSVSNISGNFRPVTAESLHIAGNSFLIMFGIIIISIIFTAISSGAKNPGIKKRSSI